MSRLPEELVELIFDRLLEQYPPDLGTKYSLFALGDRQALSALKTVSLMAARRTRTHRFKCVVLLRESKVTKFFKLLASFLELSFSSRYMGRLLPISTITTHIKVIALGCKPQWDRNLVNSPNDDKVMAFILRLRNEFSLQRISWSFDPRFRSSLGFNQRFAGLLLTPRMTALYIHNLTSYPSQLQGAYIPGPSFDRIFRFGEEDGVGRLGTASDIYYPSYAKLELGGFRTSGLPLPFEIMLPTGSVHRPFARVTTFRAFDDVSYSVVRSVLENNHGELRSLQIETSFDAMAQCEQPLAMFITSALIHFLSADGPNSVANRCRPYLPLDFIQLPRLTEVKIEYRVRRQAEEHRLSKIRRFILEAALKLFDITNQHLAGDPIPVKALDLGKIPLLLAPERPLSYPPHPHYAAQVDVYSVALAQGPIPSDVDMWQSLDAAFCTPRFANLATLRMDYVVFDTRSIPPDPPEDYADAVQQLVAPSDWLSITKRFFPRTCALDRVRLEGRIIVIVPWSHFSDIDYSKELVYTGQYP